MTSRIISFMYVFKNENVHRRIEILHYRNWDLVCQYWIEDIFHVLCAYYWSEAEALCAKDTYYSSKPKDC